MVWNRMQKYVPLVKQNVMKLEVFILGQRIDQEKEGGWWKGRREKREDWEWEQREDRDREKRVKRELS